MIPFLHCRLLPGRLSFPCRFAIVIAMGCIPFGAGSAGRGAVPARQTITAHLEEDQRIERIVLDPQHDPSIGVWRGGVCLWRGVPQRWKPWKVAAADVDGDGRQEIIVGVYKKTRFYPFLHNCLFVYGWDSKQGTPKWLGSSLSRPFVDFTFLRLPGRRAAQLVSVEKLRGRRFCVVGYSWNGFGFTGDWQQGSWKRVRIVGCRGARVILQADGRRVVAGT